MQSSLADLLDAWHDFDLLIGTAAATLVGLMFVAASIGASVFLEKDRAAMKAFISPTVVHFSAVLVVALVSLIPSHDWPALAGLFYALIPVLGYLLLLLAALVLFRQSPAGLDLLAAAQITLLLAGIRNAWDMMLWIVIRAPTPNVGDRGDAASN